MWLTINWYNMFWLKWPIATNSIGAIFQRIFLFRTRCLTERTEVDDICFKEIFSCVFVAPPHSKFLAAPLKCLKNVSKWNVFARGLNFSLMGFCPPSAPFRTILPTAPTERRWNKTRPSALSPGVVTAYTFAYEPRKSSRGQCSDFVGRSGPLILKDSEFRT